MRYRELGRTGLQVSEIGLGAEWLERHNQEEVTAVIQRCESYGINILDCWMSNPEVRTKIGNAIQGHREKWIIQGHFGSTWQEGQYVRNKELSAVKPAFQDLLDRLQTDYIDLGMITHNPKTAKLAALSGEVEMLLFSVNPAFDLLPENDDLDAYFEAETYAEGLGGMNPERAELYKLCEQRGVGITVMKGYAGGRLFDAKTSPFGVALTPVQCIHYALTRPAVASVLVGYDTPEHVDAAVAYETATEEERDYASVLAKAPHHAYGGQCTYCGHCAPCPAGIDIAMVNKLYDLATMQPEVPATVKAHYGALSATAADCIACGGCETRCPFGVPVVERMEKAKALFG